MKKATASLALVITLTILIALGAQSTNVTKANPISIPSVPSIQISYPSRSIGEYVNSSVGFEVTVNTLIDSPAINSISYSLDGEAQVNLIDLKVTTYNNYGSTDVDFKAYKANISFKDLSEGNHTLVASASGMSAKKSFVVNSNYHVTALNILSPISLIYISNVVPLKIAYTGEITNAHYYLYRGRELVSEKSLSGDITLDNLSDGSYQLLVFVTTQYGQDSKAINFLVIGLPTLVVATALLIVSLSIGLLVYFKKIKRDKPLTVTPVIT